MLRVQRVWKEYDGVMAVRDLSLDIPKGEIFGLIGPNGAGKTTLLRMCCGLLDPTAGALSVAGVDVLRHPREAQAHIGYLSDFFSLYDDLKVWEYLDYFARSYKLPVATIPARVDEVLHEIGLESKRDALIKGLSRGMKQRLGIGRAVIHHPELLLLDEPASGLDPKARVQLRELLKRLREQGATIVVSSHILPDLEDFSTSIGIMEKGMMVRSGPVAQLRAERSARLIEIQSLDEGRLRAELQSRGYQWESGRIVFSGDDEALSALLLELVAAGVPLTDFHEMKQSVEELYVAISRNEVQ